MSPKTSQQYEEIRESRKKQIMEVALKLFAESGYSNTSISKIAGEAAISKGLLYNYFESKEDLLIHIMEEGMKDMVHFFDPNRDGVLTREEFIYFIHEAFGLMNSKLLFYKLYFSVMMQPTVMGLFEKRIGEIIQPLLKSLADYYQRNAERFMPWHPLVSGRPDSVHRAGISVLGRAVSENDTDEYTVLRVVDSGIGE